MTEDSAQTAATGSAARALMILDLVLHEGPVSPARLTELSGLSRTAVHRAIHVLIDQGFIRYQLGKMHVIVTAGLRARFEQAFFSPPGIDAISRAVDTALKGRRLQCEIAVLSRTGDYVTVESTAADAETEDDFLHSELVSVLLSNFDPVDVTRITARALREAGEGARVEPAFLDRFRQAQYQGFLWNGEERTLSVRLRGDAEQAVAIRLFLRGAARVGRKEFVETVEAMRTILPEVFPKIAIIRD